MSHTDPKERVDQDSKLYDSDGLKFRPVAQVGDGYAGGKRLIQTDHFLLDCVVNKLGFIVDAQVAHQVELVRLDSSRLG